MAFADDFAALVGDQPAGWTFFECYLTIDDPLRLTEARVGLARANARPVRDRSEHDFEITVANTHGHGATAAIVESALRIVDDLGITGHVWFGATYDSLRPAPAHRAGP